MQAQAPASCRHFCTTVAHGAGMPEMCHEDAALQAFAVLHLLENRCPCVHAFSIPSLEFRFKRLHFIDPELFPLNFRGFFLGGGRGGRGLRFMHLNHEREYFLTIFQRLYGPRNLWHGCAMNKQGLVNSVTQGCATFLARLRSLL